MESRAKAVLLGGCGCGKSSIAKKFLSGSFDPNHSTTIGAVYQSKTFEREGAEIALDIWDTAGQERYSGIAPMYYRDAHVVLVVYDVTDSDSVAVAKKWCSEVRLKNKEALLVVFGNKTDLLLREMDSPRFTPRGFTELRIKESLRSICSVAKTQFKEYDAVHLCGSAKTGEGVDFLFKTICSRTKCTRRPAKTHSSWWCL